MQINIAAVLVLNISLDMMFDYIIPENLLNQIEIGKIVEVEFGNNKKSRYGVVFDIKICDIKDIENIENTENIENKKTLYNNGVNKNLKLKEILSIVERNFSYSHEMIELAKWMHGIYVTKYINILRCIAPSSLFLKTYKYKNNSDKLLNSISLSKNRQVIREEIEKLKNKAPTQVRILEYLLLESDVPQAQLLKKSNSTYVALNALKKKNLLEVRSNVVKRDAYNAAEIIKTEAPLQTEEQKYVINQLISDIDSRLFLVSLLHGVTGSGKTEVYLQLIDHVIKEGRQAIVLVPEISLTPQTIGRFVGRLGNTVSVLHSSLSAGEKHDEWKRIYNQESMVVVGTRSAIFAPLKNIGIIVIDEEHENTYKSESNPKYHVIDIAQKRAKYHNSVLLLASATPSIVSYYKASTNRYKLLKMSKRYNNVSLPKVMICDMRKELISGNKTMFSELLQREINKNITNNEQAILFLNRRGHSSSIVCRECGHTVKCVNCTIALSFHKSVNKIMCHTCGYKACVPKLCPNCGSKYIRYLGDGTQKVEEEIQSLFPHATYLRMDADMTRNKGSHREILENFEKKNINILLGTQMITKGLDFKNVTLTGVIAADHSLNMHDLHAYERTFSLITQVCGRSGRGSSQGRAIIQTYQPECHVIKLAQNHDYVGFYIKEIESRKLLNNPPFTDIIVITASSENIQASYDILSQIKQFISQKSSDLRIYGPNQPLISKLNNLYRFCLYIKIKVNINIIKILHEIRNKYPNNTKIKLDIDINAL